MHAHASERSLLSSAHGECETSIEPKLQHRLLTRDGSQIGSFLWKKHRSDPSSTLRTIPSAYLGQDVIGTYSEPKSVCGLTADIDVIRSIRQRNAEYSGGLPRKRVSWLSTQLGTSPN